MKNEWLASILGDGVELTPEQDAAIAKYVAKAFVSKNDFNEKIEALKTAQATIDANNATMEELKKAGASSEELQKKFQELQAANEKIAQAAAAKEQDTQVVRAVLKAGARDENAVLAMLDRSKIQFTDKGIVGLDDQLEQLQKEKAWAFNGGGQQSRVSPGGTPDISAEEDTSGYMNGLIRGNTLTEG